MKPFTVVVLATALVAAPGFSQAQNKLTIYGSGGFGLSSTYARLYNPSAIVTVHGKITGVTVGAPLNGVSNSVRLVVRSTNGGSSLVEVGPAWFVNNQSVKLHVRDHVTVIGSKINLDGRGSIMARRIVKGRSALVLRDAAGHPYWVANQVLMSASDELVTSGSSAQEIAVTQSSAPIQVEQTQPTQQVAVLPYNGTAPVYMAPATLGGVVQGFSIQNGGVFMGLSTSGGTMTVYLGPDWYVERQDTRINVGDIVEASVFSPIPNTSGISYAQTITDGNSTMFLLNNTGIPNWQPWYPVAWPTPRPMPRPIPVSPGG